MDLFLSMITTNGIYILPCAVILVAIAVLAIVNAENCPYPAECFNCRNSSCNDCNLLS